jgi:transposase-like protein
VGTDAKPTAEEDYPKTLLEMEARFATEEACREYLTKLRWPKGFICPACQCAVGWPDRRHRWTCQACRRQSTVTAGTIFEGTHFPLTVWFRAVWLVTNQKSGASALGIQRVLGLGSYETAWSWLHKLRRAMVRPSRERLSGTVEVDETFIGGLTSGAGGRDATGKQLIAIAAEEDGAAIGRIRLARVADASAPSLHAFIENAIEPGSTVHTDGWPSYRGLDRLGYKHTVTTILPRRREVAVELLPRVHKIASLLKRWLLGTHQGGVSPTHLDYYLDEFTFRFNRRRSASRGKLFFRLLQQAVQVGPVTYDQIVGKGPNAADPN